MEPPLTTLVPVNRLDRAKGRLAGSLSPEQREALALATLQTVLAACQEAGFAPVVLTGDPRVAEVLPRGVRLLAEGGPAPGLNAQLEWALGELGLARPGAAVLILHADLPLATAAALRAFVAAAPPAPSATLAESPDGGTNAMLLRPPGRFALAYGRGSCAEHKRRATAAGLAVAVIQPPELALDLDTPEDLATLLALPEGRASPAGKLLAASC